MSKADLRSIGLALGAAAVVVAVPDSVQAGEPYVYDMTARGSVRMTGAYMHFRDLELTVPPADAALGGSVMRLLLDGGLGRYFDYEVNAFADVTAGGQFGGTFATAGSVRSPYRTRYLTWTYWDEGSVDGRLGLDRANLRLLAGPVEATVGRQVINHSVTNMFTPNDFFAPFSATAVNRIYKPGVDAVHMGVAPTFESHFGIDAVLGSNADDEPTWGKSAVLARASLIRWGFQGALLGGKIADRWVAGASLQGEVGPVGVRTEGHVGFPDREDDGLDASGLPIDESELHGRLAAGLELPLPWRSAMLSGEYAYYSDGAAAPGDYLARLTRLFPDDQAFSAQHYAGASLGFEVMPLLFTSVFTLVNATDGSGMAGANGSFSVADEADFVAGVFAPWGKAPLGDSGEPLYIPDLRSEFGMMPLVVYLETRFYY